MDIQVNNFGFVFNRVEAGALYNEIEVIRRKIDPEYFNLTILKNIFDALSVLGIQGDD